MECSSRFRLDLPHHIKNALTSIDSLRKQVDLVINVADSRISKSIDMLMDLEELFPGVKVLTIFSKPDLSTEKLPNSFNLKLQKNRNLIIRLIKKTLKNNKLEIEGYVSPHFQILVVGLPNVGKSTLINLLKNKKISPSANTPGITKKVVKYYLGDNLWLYDSPGIFLYKKSNPDIFRKLFLINAIPSRIEHYSELLEEAFLYLEKHYRNNLEDMVLEPFSNYCEFISLLASRYNFMNKGLFDIERAERKFLDLIRNGNLRIFWDFDQ